VRALTARQRQVLLLAANGNTNAAIGRLLDVHHTTVNRHLAEIYRALGARDRANAVALALRYGDLGIGDIQVPEPPRASVTRQEAADGPQGVPEAANGARDVRGAAGAADGRTAPRGEAAA
jgi:DNA-binding CsgD family transcriptional regulator